MKSLFVLISVFLVIMVSGCTRDGFSPYSSQTLEDTFEEIEKTLSIQTIYQGYNKPHDAGAPSCISHFGERTYEVENKRGDYRLVISIMQIFPSEIDTCLDRIEELHQSYSDLYEKYPDVYINWTIKNVDIDGHEVLEQVTLMKLAQDAEFNYVYTWQYDNLVISMSSSESAIETDLIEMIKKINLFD